jgi:hypothetical protein
MQPDDIFNHEGYSSSFAPNPYHPDRIALSEEAKISTSSKHATGPGVVTFTFGGLIEEDDSGGNLRKRTQNGGPQIPASLNLSMKKRRIDVKRLISLRLDELLVLSSLAHLAFLTS